MNRKWIVEKKNLLISLSFVIGIMILYQTFKVTKENEKQHVQKVIAKDVLQNISSSQYLQEAKRELYDGYKPDKDPTKASWGKVYDARVHLEAIKSDAPEYIEAQDLLKEVERREKEIKQISEALSKSQLMKQRQDIVPKLEKYFLGKNMNVHVVLKDSEDTVLILEYIQWIRPLIYKVVNGTGFLISLKNLGFKQVIFDTTYDYSWTFDLEGNGGEE